ncbi:MAG: amidohydrolase [Chloroflexi bacterium]|nr:amidohydrolase [Chloroflexota bacterium]
MTRPIDVHVHPSTRHFLVDSQGPFAPVTEAYFHTRIPIRSEEEMVQDLDGQGVRAVLLGWDAETATGLPPIPNDWIAHMVRTYPGVFVAGFAGVDPWKGKAALREVERAAKELGLRGLKFQQGAQAFFPNDQRFYPLWAKAQELGTIALFHVGITGMGAGGRGGMGIRMKYTQPVYIDDVAADFPDLRIICAHPAWPWLDEMIAIAIHKPNVYIDLSGWSPKYFPPALVRDVNSRLQDKALFGTDYPFLTHRRWLDDFAQLDIKQEVREKVLHANAERLLGLKP